MTSQTVNPLPVNDQVHPMIVRLLTVAELLINPEQKDEHVEVNTKPQIVETTQISSQKSSDLQEEV